VLGKHLLKKIGLSGGQKILIHCGAHCGAGGIGSIAIQLAKKLGGYVTTTVSTDDKQLVQMLGSNSLQYQEFRSIINHHLS
jgi:alcohol dehydrogenase